MPKSLLIFLMLFITLANLVYAADAHEAHHQGDDAPRMLFEGHIDPHDDTHASMDECCQTHSCQAHSHIFSPALVSWANRLVNVRHEPPNRIPMPAQQGAAPPVPPPIA